MSLVYMALYQNLSGFARIGYKDPRLGAGIF